MYNYLSYISTIIFVLSSCYLKAQDDNSEYLKELNHKHFIANKISNIDYLYNLSLDEFSKLPSETIEKTEHFRFNYWINDTCEVIYGNPNSTDKSNITCFRLMNDTTATITKIRQEDEALIKTIAQIISQHDTLLIPYRHKRIDFNPFIINRNDTIELYFIPTWQQSGYIISASEYYFRYKYDSTSNSFSLIDSLSTVKSPLYYKLGTEEIVLDYSDSIVPPVGAFVFSIIYHEYFNRIILESKEKKSYLMNIFDGSYVHINKN